MKIVFTISQLSGGGAERVVALLSGEMAKRGHKVSIVTLLECPVVYEINPNVEHICLKCKNSRITGTIEQIKVLRNYFRRICPDVIVSFLPVVNMTAIFANRGLKSKLIVSERNDPNQNPRKKGIRKFRDLLYKYADGYVFQTPDAKEYFTKLIGNRGTVIPNPITGKLPTFDGVRRKAFVTAVRLEPQKNLDLLINAFKEVYKTHPDYTLEIYGEGNQREHLENLIKMDGLTDRVLLKGFQKNLHETIYDATAFVLSSNYEGISNSMIEALGMGMPVISTDHPIGGARMFIEDGVNGYLVPINGKDEMKSAMLKVIEEPELAEQMGRRARDICNRISVDAIVNKWIDYINEVLMSRDECR